METPKKTVSRRAVVRGLALAAVAQGFLALPPALAQPGSNSEQLQAQPPADPGTASIIGVL